MEMDFIFLFHLQMISVIILLFKNPNFKYYIYISLLFHKYTRILHDNDDNFLQRNI